MYRFTKMEICAIAAIIKLLTNVTTMLVECGGHSKNKMFYESAKLINDAVYELQKVSKDE